SWAKHGYVKDQPLRFINHHISNFRKSKYEVDPATGCWNFLGRLDKDGYAAPISVNGKMVRAQRAFYRAAGRDLPDDLELDHLCRNRRCVNPDHLEPVTKQEKARRRGRRAHESGTGPIEGVTMRIRETFVVLLVALVAAPFSGC